MWLEPNDNAENKEADNWLKIPNPEAVHGVTEVRLRVLDEEPIGTWRHWLARRPYNCPGMETCPVCKVRNQAKKDDPDGYKNKYRLDYRYFFNVLFEHEVKVWSFTNKVGESLKMFEEKYGDLRNYDISIRKRKTGPLDQNIEYTTIYEKEFALSTEDVAIAENRFDRTPFIAPADLETLRLVAQGVEPVRIDPEATPEENEQVNAKSTKAMKSDMILLKALIESKGYELSHFGIVDGKALPKEVVDKLIEELKAEK